MQAVPQPITSSQQKQTSPFPQNPNQQTPEKASCQSLPQSAAKKKFSLSMGLKNRKQLTTQKSSLTQGGSILDFSALTKKNATPVVQTNVAMSSQVSAKPSSKELVTKNTNSIQFSRTNQALKKSKQELESSCDRILSFFLQNIVMGIFKIVFYFWYVVLMCVAFPIKLVVYVVEGCLGVKGDPEEEQTKSTKCFITVIKCRCRAQHNSKLRQQNRQKLQEYLQKTESDNKRLQVVLDLDNTLIHSVMKEPSDSDKNYFEIKDQIYVYKRPHLDYFLNELHKIADIHVFTASHRDYANQILEMIDPRGVIQKKFYREDCKKDENNQYIKDLTIVCDDLTQVIMVDDSQINYERNKLNTFKIQYWTKQLKDDMHLKSCLTMISQLRYADNIQTELSHVQSLHQSWISLGL